MSYYPDTHPDVVKHVTTVQVPGKETAAQYVPRALWEKAAKERDDLNRTLAILAVEWWAGPRRDAAIEQLLRRAGQAPDQAKALAGVIGEVQADLETQRG